MNYVCVYYLTALHSIERDMLALINQSDQGNKVRNRLKLNLYCSEQCFSYDMM